MSIRLMTAVWDNGPADRSDMIVLLALADYANDEGFCWPGLRAVAARARMDQRSVRRVLRRLEEDKWIRTNLGGGSKPDGRGISNQYQLNANRLNRYPDTASPPPGPEVPPARTLDAPYPDTGSPDPSVEPPKDRKASSAKNADALFEADNQSEPTPNFGADWADEWFRLTKEKPPAASVKRVARDATLLCRTQPVIVVAEAVKVSAQHGHANIGSTILRLQAERAGLSPNPATFQQARIPARADLKPYLEEQRALDRSPMPADFRDRIANARTLET